jgi:hypothetical protein
MPNVKAYGSPRSGGTTTANSVVMIATIPVPREQWPGWAKGIAFFEDVKDKGIGDTVAEVIGPFTSSLFKKWHRMIFKTECNCPKRQAQWNAVYPYEP